MDEDARNSVGYCGLYCSACGIHQGKIRKAVENLQKVLRTYGVDRIALKFVDMESSFKHYEDFEKVLDGLVNLFGDCVGCFAGDGDPNCVIRECCRQRAPATCVDCLELDTCEKLRAAVLFQQCVVNTLKVKKKRSQH